MTERRAVMITGTSTGIGRACALHLDAMGFRVFAGVRREADGEALGREACGLEPVLIDVTDPESIAGAAAAVAERTGGELYGLVNNAGVSGGGPVETTPIARVRNLMEVNVLGLLAVTQAFIPQLRRGRGRIVNMGSAAGLIAAPGASQYASSKRAVEAITESLRVELRPFGIFATIVVPGAVESEIWNKSATGQEALLDEVPAEIVELYGPLFEFFRRLCARGRRIPAGEVAAAVAHALTAKKPKYRYLVGRDARMMARVARLPTRWRDRLMIKTMYRFAPRPGTPRASGSGREAVADGPGGPSRRRPGAVSSSSR